MVGEERRRLYHGMVALVRARAAVERARAASARAVADSKASYAVMARVAEVRVAEVRVVEVRVAVAPVVDDLEAMDAVGIVAKAQAVAARARVARVVAARASLCSTRSRYIPSRRSHRRLRPWLGPTCSRHLEHHKTLGKGHQLRTLSSSGDPRSAMRVGAEGAVGKATAAGARAGAGGEGRRGEAEAEAMSEAKKKVSLVRAAAVPVVAARVAVA